MVKNGASTRQSGVRLALARLCGSGQSLAEATVAADNVATDHGNRKPMDLQLNLQEQPDTVESSMADCTLDFATSFHAQPQYRSDGERTTGDPPAAASGDDTPTAPGQDRTENPDQRQHHLEGRLAALEYKLGLYPDPQASFEERLTVATDVLKRASALPEVCISLLSADAVMAYWNIKSRARNAAARPTPGSLKEVIEGLDQVQAEMRALRGSRFSSTIGLTSKDYSLETPLSIVLVFLIWLYALRETPVSIVLVFLTWLYALLRPIGISEV
ncbi:hypothetical protein C8R46DRAFT_1042132 [Mycena filopes]|nr:hypothetical protein C8R46DRAFT_1042132 [Mycena filopes]